MTLYPLTYQYEASNQYALSAILDSEVERSECRIQEYNKAAIQGCM
jgi:hypothetical protein